MENENQAVDAAKITKPKFDMTKVTRSCGSFALRIAELLIVGYLGTLLGTNWLAATIITDCQQVATAKVGDRYVKCDLVPKKKDPETAPPR